MIRFHCLLTDNIEVIEARSCHLPWKIYIDSPSFIFFPKPSKQIKICFSSQSEGGFIIDDNQNTLLLAKTEEVISISSTQTETASFWVFISDSFKLPKSNLFSEKYLAPLTMINSESTLKMTIQIIDLFQQAAPLSEIRSSIEQFVAHGYDELKFLDAPVWNRSHIVERLKGQLCSNWTKTLLIEDLAQELRSHPAYLTREFKKAFGQPPYQYSLCMRLEKVRKLLKSGLNSTEAALQGGFSDQSHFIKHFKKNYRITPKQYQKMTKNFTDN